MAYGAVDRQTWHDEKFRRWNRDTRDVWLYLLTCPHGNRIGCFVLSPLYVADDVQISTERARECLDELEEEGRIVWDPRARVVCIVRHMHPDYNPLANENVVKAAVKDLKKVPDAPRPLYTLLWAVEKWERPHYKRLSQALRNRIETLPETVGEGLPEFTRVSVDPDPDPDPDPEKENNTPRGGGDWTERFEQIVRQAMWLGDEPPDRAPSGWTLGAELRQIASWRQGGHSDDEIEGYLLGGCVLRDAGAIGLEPDEGVTVARLRYDSRYDAVDQWTKYPHALVKHIESGKVLIGNYRIDETPRWRAPPPERRRSELEHVSRTG